MLVGRFALSQSHLDEGMPFYDPISHRSLVHQVGRDPHVSLQAYSAIVSSCLGFPDRALAQSNAAISEARKLAHPPSLALSLSLGTLPLSFVRDDVALEERAEQLVTIAAEQGFPVRGCDGNDPSWLGHDPEW